MGRSVKRGEVRWCAFQSPDKRRPVLILTRNSAIRFLTNITVAPITTTVRDIPTEVYLTPADGLMAECCASLDNIQTVSKNRLGDLIAVLTPERMAEVDQAISFALGIGHFGF